MCKFHSFGILFIFITNSIKSYIKLSFLEITEGPWKRARLMVICIETLLFKILFHDFRMMYSFKDVLDFFLKMYIHWCKFICLLLSFWPTRDHIGRSIRISNPVMTSSVGGAKGCSDHRFRARPQPTLPNC